MRSFAKLRLLSGSFDVRSDTSTEIEDTETEIEGDSPIPLAEARRELAEDSGQKYFLIPPPSPTQKKKTSPIIP